MVRVPGYPPGVFRKRIERFFAMSATANRIYLVQGMSCDHCRAAIVAELGQVAGVESVDVDLEAKVVRVSGEGLDDAAIIAAVDEAGYDAVVA